MKVEFNYSREEEYNIWNNKYTKIVNMPESKPWAGAGNEIGGSSNIGRHPGVFLPLLYSTSFPSYK